MPDSVIRDGEALVRCMLPRLTKEALKPFDMGTAPLFRAAVFRWAPALAFLFLLLLFSSSIQMLSSVWLFRVWPAVQVGNRVQTGVA